MRVSFTNPGAYQLARHRPEQAQSPAAGIRQNTAPSAELSRSSPVSSGDDVASARSTAYSALRNERFGTMLRQLSDPGASGSVALMRNDGAAVDNRTAFARYAENSD